MCGIAGAIDEVPERAAARVSLLNDAQAHRGPDHRVIARVGGITLGNTRLAVQDPTPAGNQPFVSADRRYTCVFNGEIYNFRQLAERYRLTLHTACDGEVIPQLWAKLGPDSLAELRGMFAIALADALADRLYLVRDPFGIKPLYWRVLPDGSLVFASEIRPLARLAPGPRADDAAVARYLRYGAMAADQSPFREINAVPPHSVAIVRQDRRVEVRLVRPGGPAAVQDPPSDLGAALTQLPACTWAPTCRPRCCCPGALIRRPSRRSAVGLAGICTASRWRPTGHPTRPRRRPGPRGATGTPSSGCGPSWTTAT